MKSSKILVILIILLFVTLGVVSGCEEDDEPKKIPQGKIVIMKAGTNKVYNAGDVIPCNTKLHVIFQMPGAAEAMPVMITWSNAKTARVLGKIKIDGASNVGGPDKISKDIGAISCDESIIIRASDGGEGTVYLDKASGGKEVRY